MARHGVATGAAVVAAAALVLVSVALVGWATQPQEGGAVELVTTTSSIARMLAAQQPKRIIAGKKGPEIPDPHPDPDPWPYPGHPARSPIKSGGKAAAAAQKQGSINAVAIRAKKSGLAQVPKAKNEAPTHKKTLREDRLGIVAEPQLGRAHGCKPEQITIMPTDDCDPLAEKMQPAIDAFDKRVQEEHGDNFAGVHWTSGDVGPDTDAFPYYEHHGGYSGFGFHDIIYDTHKGVHPTLYKPTVGYEPHKYTMGTSFLKKRSDHSLKEYKSDDKQIAMLIAEGNHDLVRSRTASPSAAERMLRDATVDFKAARAYKNRMEPHASSQRTAAAPQQPSASRVAAQKTLKHKLQSRSTKEVAAYVNGLQGDDAGGLLLNAVGAIDKEARQLRNVADSLQTSNNDRLERVSRETLDVKAALAALDTAASGMGNV
jgi:hypothetical protein